MTRALARTLAPAHPRERGGARRGAAPGAVDARPTPSASRARRRSRGSAAPEDVAQAVCYLLEADYVTGETLIVDGGRHVR